MIWRFSKSCLYPQIIILVLKPMVLRIPHFSKPPYLTLHHSSQTAHAGANIPVSDPPKYHITGHTFHAVAISIAQISLLFQDLFDYLAELQVVLIRPFVDDSPPIPIILVTSRPEVILTLSQTHPPEPCSALGFAPSA